MRNEPTKFIDPTGLYYQDQEPDKTIVIVYDGGDRGDPTGSKPLANGTHFEKEARRLKEQYEKEQREQEKHYRILVKNYRDFGANHREEMIEWLKAQAAQANGKRLDELIIIDHGESGQQFLGDRPIYNSYYRQMKEYMKQKSEGRLTLYGCNIGSDPYSCQAIKNNIGCNLKVCKSPMYYPGDGGDARPLGHPDNFEDYEPPKKKPR